MWTHLWDLSGSEIATFVKTYIKDPIASIAVRERKLLDLGLRFRTGADGDSVEVTVGDQTWIIQRPRLGEGIDLIPEDADIVDGKM